MLLYNLIYYIDCYIIKIYTVLHYYTVEIYIVKKLERFNIVYTYVFVRACSKVFFSQWIIIIHNFCLFKFTSITPVVNSFILQTHVYLIVIN